MSNSKYEFEKWFPIFIEDADVPTIDLIYAGSDISYDEIKAYLTSLWKDVDLEVLFQGLINDRIKLEGISLIIKELPAESIILESKIVQNPRVFAIWNGRHLLMSFSFYNPEMYGSDLSKVIENTSLKEEYQKQPNLLI